MSKGYKLSDETRERQSAARRGVSKTFADPEGRSAKIRAALTVRVSKECDYPGCKEVVTRKPCRFEFTRCYCPQHVRTGWVFYRYLDRVDGPARALYTQLVMQGLAPKEAMQNTSRTDK